MLARLRLLALFAAASFAWSVGGAARAATTRAWNAFDGNWSTAGNWNPVGVPAAGDTVNIYSTDGVSRTITYDYTGAAVTLGSLAVDLTGGTPADTETLTMSANNLTAGFEYVGFSGAGSNGSGTVNQSGGINTITSTSLYLGLNATDTGYYNLSGTGSLVNNGSSGEIVGYAGTGYFTQSGGSNSSTASSGSGLTLGYLANSSGTYTLNSGTLTMGSNTVEYLGFGASSSGTFVQNGGSNLINGSNSLYIAYGANSSGNYTLNAGSLLGLNEFIGYASAGSFTQTGGSNTTAAAGLISLGVNVGSSGTYTMTGGTLTSGIGEFIGSQGVGEFDQSGGLNSLPIQSTSAAIYLGYIGNGIALGTYNLSGTGAITCRSYEYVGYGAEGDFNQSGGTNTLSGGLNLYLGYSSGVTGTYTLSGSGILSSNADEIIGQGGIGVFNQSGGVNMLAGATSPSIDLGRAIGSIGTYNLSGGAVTVGGNVNVGLASGQAVGVLSVSGGTLNVSGTIVASNVSGSSITLSGGTINTAALDLNDNPAALTWTSGTLDITTNLTLDSLAAGTSTGGAFGPALTLSGGQTLMVSGNENIGGAGLFTLTLADGGAHVVTGTLTLTSTGVFEQDDGSTLYAATFTQAGGTVNGTLQNQGTFNYQSGQFNGRLLNQGTVALGANFVAADGIENDTSMTVAAGQTVVANGDGLDNLGLLALSGGTISGDGPFVNEFAGTIQGHGIVNPAVSNFGTISVSGALAMNGGLTNDGLVQGAGTISGSFSNEIDGTVNVAAATSLSIAGDWTNSGLIALQGTTARLGGGAITNNGTIQGFGLINSAVTNTGTIEPLGGTLSFGGTVLNPAGGLIRVGTSDKVLVTHGLLANAGIINLTGGTFDNNGQPMNNLGQISGYGVFATGGTGLDNNGGITLSGGVTTVNGPVTNESGQTITIAQNPAIFTGLVTNNGGATFNVTNATATFAGGFTNNGSSNFAEVGNGLIQVNAAPSLGAASSISVGGSSTLRFNAISGAATIGAGVSATVATGATLQLAGSVSALSGGSVADVVNNGSTASGGGLLVTGTNQLAGTITGAATTSAGATTYGGDTVVAAGASLTAEQILQNTLTIGAGATVTIAPSDAGSPGVAASSGNAASFESSNDPLAAIQSAIDAGAISSAAGRRLENRITAIEALAAADPGLDASLLEARVLASIPSSSLWSSSGVLPIAETGASLLATDGSQFTSGSASTIGNAFDGSGVGGPAAVPEPSTLLLAALGGLGLAIAARRRTLRARIVPTSLKR